LTRSAAASLCHDDAALAIWAEIRRFAAGLDGTVFRPRKAQISLEAGHPFAAVWHPGAVLHRAAPPLVLSVFARERLEGPWKEVVEPRPHRFSHHAELQAPEDFGPALQDALRRAHAAA